jgi:DNA-binding NarL/FixJ family response regulator
LIADLVKKLLESEFEVVGVANNGRDLIRVAAESAPDVVVSDIPMPVLNGLDAGERIKEMQPGVRLVFLTTNPDPEVAAEAFRRGASGYLLKSCTATELMTAVRDVLRGKSFLSKTLSRDTVNYLQRQDRELVPEEARLTGRQREVLQLLAEGKTSKEIGSILDMTVRTVCFHKYRTMEILGAKNNADLFKYAIRNHMVAA